MHGSDDGYYRVIGDSIAIYNNKLEFEMTEAINTDIERYHQLYPVNATALSETDSDINYLLILTALVLLGIGGYIFLFRRKIKAPSSEDMHQLVDQLIPIIGKTLSSDELDQALNIPEYLSPENARYKRSKLVNEINEYYRVKFSTDLITRIKDPNDKRKFFYRINS
ncbi:MAG: LPXTG cell wall anchor domain-containing protein [Saprospiraceae bacterium]|nr:LPXTG cell wall anchor domain-containing protein [Saprospiraceae bacterium]